MNYLIFILFMVAHCFLLFRLPALYHKNKVLQITGVGIVASLLLLGISYFAFLIYAQKIDDGILIYEKQFIKYFLGITALFFFSFFVHLFTDEIMENVLIKFHRDYNSKNLHKQPVKFFISNIEKIKQGFRFLFFLGGFLVFYGVCFGAK